MKTIEFKNLTKEYIMDNQPGEFKIIKNNVDFYINIVLKENNDKLVVFSNGAVNRSKKEPPIFMRSSWHEEINANCIFIDDRTLHGNNLSLGWGIGNEKRYFLHDYSQIIIRISVLLNLNVNNIMYYGSSAGGFMSINLATMHRGTTALVNNPQVIVNNYLPSHVNRLYRELFPDMTPKEILRKYTRRFSVIPLMRLKEYVPRIFYFQNRLCEQDMQNHFNVFLKKLDFYKLDSSKIEFILYNNVNSGHNPLPKNKTVYHINNILDRISE